MAQSLAVKHRPTTLDEIVGQPAAKKVLQRVFDGSDDVPSAFALIGNTGCGKTTFARMIARRLNCAKDTGCGKCDSCKIFDTDPKLHPDFKNTNAATNGGKDDIRELVELSHYAPTFKYRVILIDEAHTLTPAGKEALLLDVEEPKEQTIWIIATTEPHKLPKTLLDRCTKLLMQPAPVEELAERLIHISKLEGFKLPSKAATRISEYAAGHVRNAIQALEDVMREVKTSKKGKKKKIDGKALGKAIEEAFYNADEMEQTTIAAALLISLYEGNAPQAIQYIGQAKDHVGLATKLSFANGFIIYRIMQMGDPKIKSPYYPTPENKMIFDAIYPDIKSDKAKKKTYYRGAIKLTPRIVKLRQELMSAGIVDPTSIVIANLLG